MRERYRATLTAVVAITVAGLVSCTTADGPATETTTKVTAPAVNNEPASDGRLRIGLLVPSTRGEAIGQSIRRAVETEVEAINTAGGVNGQTVALQVADEDNEAGLTDLVASDVDAIVGPASSLVALRRLNETIDIPNPIPTCSPAASALSLDGFDDGGWFFRTIPSDSLQIAAIADQAQQTGAQTVAVAYVDDPYGRSLADQMVEELDRQQDIALSGRPVGIASDQEDLKSSVETLLNNTPGTIVILANESLGGRLLRSLDDDLERRTRSRGPDSISVDDIPTILINDSVSTARQAISELSEDVRARVGAITQRVEFTDNAGEKTETKYTAFAAQAIDCVDLIALAAVQAESDSRAAIRSNIGSVSSAGTQCTNFERCAQLLTNDRLIDYAGRSGPVDLDSTGDLKRGRFLLVWFNENGTVDVDRTRSFTAQSDTTQSG